MYIKLSSLKANKLNLQVGSDEHKAEVLYIVADVSDPNVARYEWGYKNLVTGQVFNGLRGAYCGNYKYTIA